MYCYAIAMLLLCYCYPIGNIYNEYQTITTELYAKLNAMVADIKKDKPNSRIRETLQKLHKCYIACGQQGIL